MVNQATYEYQLFAAPLLVELLKSTLSSTLDVGREAFLHLKIFYQRSNQVAIWRRTYLKKTRNSAQPGREGGRATETTYYNDHLHGF